MTDVIDLTDAERTELDRMLAGLHDSGYQPADRHGPLVPGVRIRHRGHQWPQAYTDGTGTVAAITVKPDSSWSKSWGMPDVELVAMWDRPPYDGAPRLSQLAQYHVRPVEATR